MSQERRQKFARTFRKSPHERGVLFGIPGFGVGFWASTIDSFNFILSHCAPLVAPLQLAPNLRMAPLISHAWWGQDSRNRKRCRQAGSRQSTPLSTIRTRYANSASTPGATRTGKNKRNSLQKGSRYWISVSTPRRYWNAIADAIFADAVSETPKSAGT